MYISYACLIYLLIGNPEYSRGHLESLYLSYYPPPWICNCSQEVFVEVVVFLLYSLRMSMHRGKWITDNLANMCQLVHHSLSYPVGYGSV